MTTANETGVVEREARLEYERRILAAEVAGVKAEKAMREAAAHKATSFLVGDPENAIPLRSPMPYEIADAIRELPLSLGRDAITALPPDARELTGLGKLLKHLRASHLPAKGSHSAEMGGGPWYLNPDGPEAATTIETQYARLVEARGVVNGLARLLLPIHMTLAQEELANDAPVPDAVAVLHFMGSGASDIVSAGEFRAATNAAASWLAGGSEG